MWRRPTGEGGEAHHDAGAREPDATQGDAHVADRPRLAVRIQRDGLSRAGRRRLGLLPPQGTCTNDVVSGSGGNASGNGGPRAMMISLHCVTSSFKRGRTCCCTESTCDDRKGGLQGGTFFSPSPISARPEKA